MLKFRTMVQDADALKDSLRDRNEAQEGLFKIADDPRVTRVGQISAQERTGRAASAVQHSQGRDEPRRSSPAGDRGGSADRGLASPAPGAEAGDDRPLADPRPLTRAAAEMVAIDYLYVANWSLWKDVKILLRTVPHVLGRREL